MVSLGSLRGAIELIGKAMNENVKKEIEVMCTPFVMEYFVEMHKLLVDTALAFINVLSYKDKRVSGVKRADLEKEEEKFLVNLAEILARALELPSIVAVYSCGVAGSRLRGIASSISEVFCDVARQAGDRRDKLLALTAYNVVAYLASWPLPPRACK